MSDTHKIQKAYRSHSSPLPNDPALWTSPDVVANSRALIEGGERHGNHRNMLAKEKVRTRRGDRLEVKSETVQEIQEELRED